MNLICKKDLYRSVYKGVTWHGRAFKKGKEYEIESEEDSFIFVKDETGRGFSFAKESSNPQIYYLITDYFI